MVKKIPSNASPDRQAFIDEIVKELDDICTKYRDRLDSSQMMYSMMAFAVCSSMQCAPSEKSADEVIKRAIEAGKKAYEVMGRIPDEGTC